MIRKTSICFRFTYFTIKTDFSESYADCILIKTKKETFIVLLNKFYILKLDGSFGGSGVTLATFIQHLEDKPKTIDFNPVMGVYRPELSTHIPLKDITLIRSVRSTEGIFVLGHL